MYLESGPCKAQVVCAYLSRDEEILGAGEGEGTVRRGSVIRPHMCLGEEEKFCPLKNVKILEIPETCDCICLGKVRANNYKA